MGISQKDIKLLWGRAASRCSFPDCRVGLTQDKEIASESFPLGEQAHIIAKESDGPRGESVLENEERDSYFNRILLCPTHHTVIDGNPEDYPVERLHMIKTQHELWVEQTLSQANDLKKVAQEVVYSNLIDVAVEDCRFAEWEGQTSWALAPIPEWDRNAPERLFKFRQKIISAAWPDTLPELEGSLKTLSIVLLEAVKTFKRHSEVQGDHLTAIQFYKIDEWNPELYDKLGKEFDKWVDQCHELVFEATKAANWVAEIVRRDINPLFFAIEGKFLVTYGPNSDGSFRTVLLEYTEDEKKSMPSLFSNRIRK